MQSAIILRSRWLCGHVDQEGEDKSRRVFGRAMSSVLGSGTECRSGKGRLCWQIKTHLAATKTEPCSQRAAASQTGWQTCLPIGIGHTRTLSSWRVPLLEDSMVQHLLQSLSPLLTLQEADVMWIVSHSRSADIQAKVEAGRLIMDGKPVMEAAQQALAAFLPRSAVATTEADLSYTGTATGSFLHRATHVVVSTIRTSL
eukprot:108406-Amphidinium_carterae.1